MPEATETSQPSNIEKARAALAAKREADRASVAEKDASATAPTPAADDAPKLPPGHVFARITSLGHGRIHTGFEGPSGGGVIPPKILDDDPRLGALKGAEREKMYAKIFAQASVEKGITFGKDQVIPLPQSVAETYEEKGYVEVQ